MTKIHIGAACCLIRQCYWRPLAHAQLTKRTTDNPTASELKYGQHVRAKLLEASGVLQQQVHLKN